MKAWICNDWGDPQSLVLGEMPTPVPGKRQVLIDVHRSGVNFPDTLMIAGKYQMKPERPFVPGVECAGTVMGFGDEVSGFKVGDRVLCKYQGKFRLGVITMTHYAMSLRDNALPYQIRLLDGCNSLAFCRIDDDSAVRRAPPDAAPHSDIPAPTIHVPEPSSV